jgi:hypothetical protein
MVRFKTIQRQQAKRGFYAKCEYDPKRDFVVVKASGRPAVLDKSIRPLITKKKDVEKQEDQKDFWM